MIQTRGLRRSYLSRRGPAVLAVRDLSIDVRAGQMVALLGPNGAGKTTSMRMLTTALRPDAGDATIAGADLRRHPNEVRRRIGYVPQGSGTSPENTVREELVLQSRLYGRSKKQAVHEAAEMIEVFQLGAVQGRLTRALSGGQRRRLDIALALVHRPALILLDEPTTGLDPQSRAGLWQHVHDLRRKYGVTVLVTTHYIDEIDRHVDNIFVMDQGTVVAHGNPERLKAVAGVGERIDLRVPAVERYRTSTTVARVPGVTDVAYDGTTLSVQVAHGHQVLPTLVGDLARERVPILGMQVHRPTLDDVFLQLTGRQLREPAAAGVGADAA
ncbi:ATP-binding cassette domain-containing protein [Actinoplanes sp. CA-131856]